MRIIKAWSVAIDGVDVRHYKVGDEVTGRIAEMAKQAGVVEDSAPAPKRPRPAKTKPAKAPEKES